MHQAFISVAEVLQRRLCGLKMWPFDSVVFFNLSSINFVNTKTWHLNRTSSELCFCHNVPCFYLKITKSLQCFLELVRQFTSNWTRLSCCCSNDFFKKEQSFRVWLKCSTHAWCKRTLISLIYFCVFLSQCSFVLFGDWPEEGVARSELVKFWAKLHLRIVL